MMIEHNSETYRQYEDVAIKELCTELGLRNVQRDVILKDNSRIAFDAIAKEYGLTYLIEVKICGSTAQTKNNISILCYELRKSLKNMMRMIC